MLSAKQGQSTRLPECVLGSGHTEKYQVDIQETGQRLSKNPLADSLRAQQWGSANPEDNLKDTKKGRIPLGNRDKGGNLQEAATKTEALWRTLTKQETTLCKS